METKMVVVDKETPDERVIQEAAKILQTGGLVAFPTETVYGLGAHALDPKAVEGIFAAKGRPSDNPLIVHIAHTKELAALVAFVPPLAEVLIQAFWPGPLTLVLPKSIQVPTEISAGLPTVGVRFPQNPVAQALIRAAGIPIAAPSANISGRPSPTQAFHVAEDLYGKIDMIMDGGATEVGLESTVLDVTGAIPIILRPGGITKEMLEAVVGRVDIDPAILAKYDETLVPKAPGMKYTHYAPKAKITIVEGALDRIVEEINKQVKNQPSNKKIGIMATTQTQALYVECLMLVVGDRSHPETIAANLFAILRQFDQLGIEHVYAESLPQTALGMAIMNRLQKAAGYDIIKV